MKTVAIIPCRKGSKRLPNKNKLLLCGIPLFMYTVNEARECSNLIDEIIITSNDEDILRLSNDYKNIDKRIKVIKRPEELCQDNSEMWEVIEHACKGMENKTTIILLQPTSPLRVSNDIIYCWSEFSYGFTCTVSVFKEDNLHYRLNGAVYIDTYSNIIKNKGFEAQGLYIMPKERSLDIDTLDDFKLVEALLQKRMEESKSE